MATVYAHIDKTPESSITRELKIFFKENRVKNKNKTATSFMQGTQR